MLRVRQIDSLELPELQPYRTMRRQEEHKRAGIFVAEGEKVVRRLIESKLSIISVLLPQKWLDELRPLLEARAETVDVFVADKALLETLTGFSMYQGLLAVGKVPPSVTIEELLERRRKDHPALLVAVDGLSSAENLGALARNCAAFEAEGLLLGETCTSPFLRRAVRSSMGTIFQIPIVEPAKLETALSGLRARGFRVLAAHPHTEEKMLWQADLCRDCVLVFGSEGYGISKHVLAACDETIAVPMPPTVDSLNVASAAAVFMYEAARQRRAKKA
jgi:tRNA G18 (ribose-2'-O)-methylase SpoU